MGYILILAEKPDMGLKISEALGIKKKNLGYIELVNGDIVTWAIGHIISLLPPNAYEEYKKWTIESLPVIPKQMLTVVDENKKAQFQVIKKLLKDSTSCIISTDQGREGEHIARLILEEVNYQKPLERLWIQDLTKETIIEGFRNLKNGKEYDALAKAAKLRSYADYWIGFTATRLFTLLAQQQGQNTTLSVGRVQTPTLKIVYDREQEILNHESLSYYTLHVQFGHGQATYSGKWFEMNGQDRQDRKDHKKDFDSIISELHQDATILEINKTLKTLSSPNFLDSTSIKYYARKELKYSIDQTDKVLQKLYDEGYVTYPRTSSQHLSSNVAKELTVSLTRLEKHFPTLFPSKLESILDNKRYTDDTKALEHHAIIPTKKDPSSLQGQEKALYDIIFKITLAAFYPKAEDQEIKMITACGKHHFETTMKQIVQPGFRKLLQHLEEVEGDNELQPFVQMDRLQKDQQVNKLSSEVKEGKNKVPSRYAEDELIKAMSNIGKKIKNDTLKELGIGTPATRTNIVKELIHREYLESKKNILYITEKGSNIIKLIGNHSLSSVQLSADFEEKLEQVANKSMSFEEAETSFKNYVHSIVQERSSFHFTENMSFVVNQEDPSIGECPLCRKDVLEHSKNYGCKGYKEGCSFSIFKSFRGIDLSVKMVKQLLQGGSVVLKDLKGKEGKVYSLVLFLEQGKLQNRFPTTDELKIGDCFICQQAVMEQDKYYSCRNVQCSFKVSKVLLSKKIPMAAVKKLMKGSITDLISGFVKDGKSFDSKLQFDQEKGRIVFKK